MKSIKKKRSETLNTSIKKIKTAGIEIPLLKVGSGRPQVGIICGIHGDEKTSFLIASMLKNMKLDAGSLNIFLGVNQRALKNDKRFDNQDLNRCFPGSSDGDFENRVAHRLIKELRNQDLVIDIHSFVMDTPLLAIQFTEKDDFVDSFSPEQVWVLKSDKFSRALGPVLAKEGVRNFAIELNTIDHFNDQKRVLQGFKNVFIKLGMVKGRIIKKDCKKFFRKEVSSDFDGIFVPEKKPFDKVRKGELIGRIILMDNLLEKKVKSESNGVLMQIRRQSSVKVGDNLFSLGEEILINEVLGK